MNRRGFLGLLAATAAAVTVASMDQARADTDVRLASPGPLPPAEPSEQVEATANPEPADEQTAYSQYVVVRRRVVYRRRPVVRRVVYRRRPVVVRRVVYRRPVRRVYYRRPVRVIRYF